MPFLTVIAGPNGSGKSTITSRLDFEGRENLLDPDSIARRLNPTDPAKAAVASARQILSRIEHYLDQRISFAIETTLASKKTLKTMQKAKLNGFEVELVYICLDTPERSILRVQERVLQGGHDVPDSDVRRRYVRSLANLPRGQFKSLTGPFFMTTPRTPIGKCWRFGRVGWFGKQRKR